MMSPWSLSQAVVGLLSVAYLTGTWSSPKAGAMTVRFGRGPVMLGFTAVMLCGLLLTLFSSLWLIFIGMLLFSAGFFAAHSVASSWIGPRARRARGQASSLYLFSYYLGSSLAGTLGGVFWHHYGWERRRWVYRAAAPCRAVDRHLLTSTTEIVACDVACGPRFTTCP